MEIDNRGAKAMLALIRSALIEDEALSKEDEEIIKNNIEEIYKISKRNDIAQLIGHALDKTELISPDNVYYQKLQEQTYLAVFRYEGMCFELERMREVFEEAKIHFIPLKGAVIRSLYPEGWMRTSSDIDVLVKPEDLDLAMKLLSTKLGYKLTREGTHDRSFFTEGGVHIELHFDLVEPGKANSASEVLSDVWKYAAAVGDGKYECELTDGMFYFYHIAHLAKHLECAGAGIRPFIDLWLINNSNKRNDNERKELLCSCSLDRFASLCDELSLHWMEKNENISSTARKLEHFVMNCGIYGSEENRIAIDKKHRGGTFGYVLRRLFLPYKILGTLYPIIKRHKWLTPFCQIARWFKLLSGKMAKKAIGEIKISNSTSSQDVKEIQNFMSEIGL